MAWRNNSKRENRVIVLEGATVSIEVDGLYNFETGFERQSEISSSVGSLSRTSVEKTELSGERAVDGGASLESSDAREVIARNIGRISRPVETRLLEVGFDLEHDSRVVNLIPEPASLQSELPRDYSRKVEAISVSELGSENSEGSMLINAGVIPLHFVEAGSCTGIKNSIHSVREGFSIEDGGVIGHLEAVSNFNELHNDFCRETMQGEAKICFRKKMHYVKGENLDREHILEVGFDSEHDSQVVPLIPRPSLLRREVAGGFSRKGETIIGSEFSSDDSGETMMVDSGEILHQFVEAGGSMESSDLIHPIQEDVSLAEGSHIKGPLETVLNFKLHGKMVRAESAKGIPEELRRVKDEVDSDWEFNLRVQHPKGSGSTTNIFSQKNLQSLDQAKKTCEEFQISEMENVVHKSNTEMFKNADQHCLDGNQNYGSYEDEGSEGNVSQSSQIFQLGDMVWGKVKSHPWWPGYVFNEAFATASVKRIRKEGQTLVAFFGDSSYGWFNPLELIPFEPNFAEKSKQTSSRNFLKAVEEAVDEASRRRALGVACCCRNPHTFRPAAVEGYFAVDVADYEPGGVYSEQQIKAARDSFQPVELLTFVKQMALTPQSTEQQTIECIRSLATMLAYRSAVFKEFHGTYPHAFEVDPICAPKSVRTLDEGDPRAPLSGPFVVAEASSERSLSSKPAKSPTSKKDKCLSKRRNESSNQKPAFEENVVLSQGSGKESQNVHPSEAQNFVSQHGLPSPPEKQRTFQSNEQQGRLISVEKVHTPIKPNHAVQAAAGLMGANMADKKRPSGVKTIGSVGILHKQQVEKLSDSGGQKASVQKPKHLNREKKLPLVKQHNDVCSSISQVPLVSSTVNKRMKDGNGLQNVVKSQRLLVGVSTVAPTRHSLDTLEKSAAESATPSDAHQPECQLAGNEPMERRASVVRVSSPDSDTSRLGKSIAVPAAETTQKMAKSLKRTIQNLDDSNLRADIKVKKEKAVTLSLGGNRNHMQTRLELLPENVAHINSDLEEEGSQRRYRQTKDGSVDHKSFHIGAKTSLKSGTRSMEQLTLCQLVSDLLFLALDPFHGFECNIPARTQRVFLRFRSLVYQKSPVLRSVGDAAIQSAAMSETLDDKYLLIQTMVDSDDEQPTMGRKNIQADKANKTMKPGCKGSLLDQSHDAPVKMSSKKQQDAKVAFTGRDPNQGASERSQGERKELSNAVVKPNKLDPGWKPPPPAREEPEPTLINIKFPVGTSLPTESQLKARFARFGPLDLSGTRIFYRSGTCRVVFKFKSDARAAYMHATQNALFGHGVRYNVKEVESRGVTPEQVPAKHQPRDERAPEEGSVGGDSLFRSRGECVEKLRSGMLVPRVATQLKSCLKRPAPDDAGVNGVAKQNPRVKFMLGDEVGSERGLGRSINGLPSADGSSPPVAKDVNNNAKMVQHPPLLPLPPKVRHPPILPLPRVPPPLPFPRESCRNLYQHNQIAEGKAVVDISHQLLSLMLKCNDIVANVTCTLGYAPYHAL